MRETASEPTISEIPALERRAERISTRHRRTPAALRFAEIFLDVVTVAVAIELSYWLYCTSSLGTQSRYSAHLVLSISIILGAMMSGLLNIAGVYKPGTSLLRVRESEIVLRSSFQALMVLIVLGWLVQIPYPRTWTCLAILLACLALLVQKQLLHTITSRFHLASRAPSRALICGSGNSAKIIANALRHSVEIGYIPVATPSITDMGINEDGELADLDRHDRMILRYSPHLVIFTSPVRNISDVLDFYRRQEIRFAFTPDAVFGNDIRVEWLEIDGILLSMEGSEEPNWLYDVLKPVFDFVGAAALLVVLGPVMMLIAALIRLDSDGPCIFRQTRMGRNGKPFKMLKFRSMHSHLCGSERTPESALDPRITRVGRFLRKTSLDELPQLVNVLRGEISLVGPRPEMPFIVNSYTSAQRVRLSVKPGITGIWQLSADRRFPIHDNMHYDIYYLRERGIFLDLAILIHTLFFAVRGI